MRYHEIMGGFRVPISKEENDILQKIGLNGLPEKELTDERDEEIAHQMIRRGLLNTKRDKDGQTVYKINSSSNIWIGRF